ncbi:MAG: cation:proton antiporter [Verrucomicrobia bacterium]|nr:cation:proton antiporter [Verrucomicrobiota bacterium]
MIAEAFLRNLGLILIVAAVCSFCLRWLRLPSIVAYLFGGLILGPGTGWVELSGSLELISEVGIVLLLFLVGLELSFDKIRGMGRAVLVVGLGQMGLSAAGGFALAWLLGLALAEAAFVAIAFTFSSTVVAVKLLEEKREFNALHGLLAVGVLLLQDLGVIVLLTLMAGFKPGAQLDLAGLTRNLASAFGGMAALVVATLLASRYVLPIPLGWAARAPATLLVWSLCWCFFVVAAAHALHLSPETGAFLAGLALAQLPFNHDLRRRVHPLMNFFVAVFFVSLGVKMQLGAAYSLWPTALAFTLFVLLGKLAIVMGILARLKFSERTAWSAGLTLSQISEFSFILVAAGVAGGWVGPTVLVLVGLVGLATFSLSSCAIVFSESLFRVAQRLRVLRLFRARPTDEAAPEAPPRSGHVLVS